MSRIRSAFALLVALGAALAPLAGCGHSVEPRAPYAEAGRVPAPRDLLARYDLLQGMVITWRATPQDRALVDGWIVERRPTTTTSFTALTAGATRETTFVDGNLGDGVRVVYRVRGVTAAGIASLPVETPPLRADLVAPAPPLDVAAATAPTGIEVTFTRGPEADLAAFEVRLVELSPGTSQEFRTVPGSPATIEGLVSGALYQVDVAAVDSAGRQSAWSTPPVSAVAGP